MTTYQLTQGPGRDHKPINLPEPATIKKIGTFEISSQGVVGDTDYSEIEIEKGIYDAYQIDDNLVIINTKLGIKPDKSIKNWQWEHSGTGVGVDSGNFGFYDKAVIDRINKMQKQKGFKTSNDLSSFEYSNDAYKMMDGTKIDKDGMSDADVRTLKQIKNFGVMGATGVGDGGFECYCIGNDRAVLIGGFTSDKIFTE